MNIRMKCEYKWFRNISRSRTHSIQPSDWSVWWLRCEHHMLTSCGWKYPSQSGLCSLDSEIQQWILNESVYSHYSVFNINPIHSYRLCTALFVEMSFKSEKKEKLGNTDLWFNELTRSETWHHYRVAFSRLLWLFMITL